MFLFLGMGSFSAICMSPSLLRYMPMSDTQLACTVKVCRGFLRERKRTRAKPSSCRLPLLLSLTSCGVELLGTVLTARQASKMAPTSTSRGALLCQGGSFGRMTIPHFTLDGRSERPLMTATLLSDCRCTWQRRTGGVVSALWRGVRVESLSCA